MLLQGQTYNLTLCIKCHGKISLDAIKDHQRTNWPSKGIGESIPRSCNTKRLTEPEQGQWGVDKGSSVALNSFTMHHWVVD